MMRGSWVRRLFARPITQTIRKAPHRTRPAVEVLEDRLVPSTIVVNNPTDTPVAGETDLRQAITQANTAGGDQTITFDKTVFKTAQTITLTGSALELSDTTGTETITGPNKGVTVSGGGNSRVFQVDALVTASISGLTITGGKAGYGAGLFNLGAATLTGCTVSGNSTTTFGRGGGVNNGGTLALTNCTVSNNSAYAGCGVYNGYPGTVTLTNCTVSGNSSTGKDSGGGSNASGGGVCNIFGTATLTNCTVSGNSAIAGGGIANQGDQSMLTVASSNIIKNQATSEGGGISTGAGFGTAGVSVTITDSVINANQVNSSGTAQGGGIFSANTLLSLTNCTVNANQANGTTAQGGGIYALNSTVTVTSSTVNGNKANGSVLGEGGGIYSDNSVLILVDSTVNGNKATTSGNDIFVF